MTSVIELKIQKELKYSLPKITESNLLRNKQQTPIPDMINRYKILKSMSQTFFFTNVSSIGGNLELYPRFVALLMKINKIKIGEGFDFRKAISYYGTS